MHPNVAPSAAAPPELRELTSLRFIAALAVLVLHYRDLLGPMPDWLLRGVIGGQYGVTFFFILSGFILTYRYQPWFAGGVKDGTFWRFQRFRLARIYPIYLLGLLLDTPWHLVERAQAGALASAGPTYWASWLLNLVGLQSWVPAVPFAMFWNTPAWSVSAEFFFYATFPFVCTALCRWQPRRRSLLAAYAVVLGGGIALYAGVIHGLTYEMPVGDETRYIVLVYNPLLRYSEFLCGCLAGHAFVQGLHRGDGFGLAVLRHQGWRNAAIAACLVAIAARVWSTDYTGPSAALWLLDVSLKYGIFIAPFTLLIVAVASGRSVLSPLLGRPWMVMLGEASYALYIIHWSATTFLRMGWLGGYDSPWAHGLVLLLTIGASVLCHRYIEVPGRRWLRGSKRPEAGIAATPAAALAGA